MVTALVAILASALRLISLNQVTELVFDETYYVKDGWSLWSLGYEGRWAEDSNPLFAAGSDEGLSPQGSFVVHPPVGRWLIGAGMGLLGQGNPVGWRLAAALAGVAGVILVCRLAWQLFGSLTLTALAGVFLATDGLHLVMSRTALLDIFLSTFVLAAFLAVALDQRDLSARLRVGRFPPTSLGWRPWLLVAGVMLGLACATKWSGIYAVAVLGLFVVGREALWRFKLADPHWIRNTIFPDALVAFCQLVLVAAAVYLASWFSWFTHPDAWGHTGRGSALAQWWEYQRATMSFHSGLSTPHPYMSDPTGWLVQARPTMFYFNRVEGGDVSVISSLGNPILWWVGAAAVVGLVVATALRASWQTGFVLLGFVAMYLPWFLYPERTMFTFYAVSFAPFVALASAWLLSWLLGVFQPTGRAVQWLGWFCVGLVLLSAALYLPLWLGIPIPYEHWQYLTLFPGWG